jgi:hypothetical protein
MIHWLSGFLMVVAMIILIAAPIVIHIAVQKRRTAWMQQAAEELRFEFFPQGDGETLSMLSPFLLFSRGNRKRVQNLMQGVADQLQVKIFDYSYFSAGKQGSNAPNQTVICFRSPNLDLPNFWLQPRSFLDRFGPLLGQREIVIDGRPKFSKVYLLHGASESAVRQLFHDGALNFYEQNSGLTTEGRGFDLLIYRAEVLVKPERVRSFLEEGFKVLDLFR